MNYKLLDYDVTEYQRLEKDLNELSQKGFNPIHIHYLTHFKNTGKHYYYHIDFLKKVAGTPKRKTKFDMINDYNNRDFEYMGHLASMMVFRSETDRPIPKDRQDARDTYIHARKLVVGLYFMIALIPAFFLFNYILKDTKITDFLTNGSLLIHISAFPILITLMSRVFKMLSLTFEKSTQQIIKILNYVFYIGAIVSILCLLIGISLDFIERENKPVDQSIMTLETLDFESAKDQYPTYSECHSYIVTSKSYFEVNKKDQALYIKDYQLRNQEDTDDYFQSYKNDFKDNISHKINKDTYLLSIDGKDNSILFKLKNRFIYVSTSEDIYSNNKYQTIINFYKK